MKRSLFAIGLLLLAGAGFVQAQPAPAADSFGQPLGPITALVVARNQKAESDLRLVARVEVQPNEILEVYEPAPGLIVLSGAGAPAGPSRLAPRELEKRSPAEIWELVADGRPLPKALRAALERSLHAPAFARSRREAVPGSGSGGAEPARPGPRGGWCDTEYFATPWSQCQGGFQACLDNQGGGAYAWHTEVVSVDASVCAAAGDVAFRIRTDTGRGGSWTVPPHTLRWYHVWNGGCTVPWGDCPYLRADVDEAWNDRFHFRFNAWID